MKFVLQPLTIRVTNCGTKSRMMEGSAEKRKHGEMLPSIICAIICLASNWGKTSVLISLIENLNVHFENMSKSLQQPKYRYFKNLFTSINKIGYFTFFNNSDVVSTERSALSPNSIFIFNDVACDKMW